MRENFERRTFHPLAVQKDKISIVFTSLNKHSGYWHTVSEPEIECKEDFSTTADATFEDDLQS